MVLLYPLTRQFESKLLEWEIRRKLTGLTDRNLVDIGLERSDIRQFARAASRPNVSATPPRSPVITELPWSASRSMAEPITSLIGATGLIQRVALASIWHREFRRVRSELACHSERELTADLRISRSSIPDIAAGAADDRVAAFVRDHPEYRNVGERRGWRSAYSG